MLAPVRLCVVLGLLATFGAAPVAAQSPDTTKLGRIVGQILDAETGQPIGGVAVHSEEWPGLASFTDANGRFVLSDLPRGVYGLTISHLAYGTREELVNVPPGAAVQVTIRLSTQPIELDPIEVKVTGWSAFLESRGFYERRSRGWGHFIDQEEVELLGVQSALRHVPRLRLQQVGSSGFGYIPVFQRFGRPCMPQLWVNGIRIVFRGESLNELVSDSQVGAMEVYRPGRTPADFMAPGFTDCGAIVIWGRG